MSNDDGFVTINGRRYPSAYPPGAFKDLDEAWEILDHIKDGVIPDDVRAYLAGAIVGLMQKTKR